MATSAPTLTQHRARSQARSRLLGRPLVLWHLCSLDAPTVAVVWTWFIAHVCAIALPLTSLAAMAIAVWLLYAGDRLLDSRFAITTRPRSKTLNSQLANSPLPWALPGPHADLGELEARHLFHHRHRRMFYGGIACGTAALVPLLLAIPTTAMRLYAIEGAALSAWLLAIHTLRGTVRLPKELAVGPFFAAAVFIPTISRVPQIRPSLVLPAILLASLCCLNCLFIYAWEHDSQSLERAHPSTRFALRFLPWIAIAVGIVGCLAAGIGAHPAIPRACALSVAGLLLLHARRNATGRVPLRALADLVLLTPLLLGL